MKTYITSITILFQFTINSQINKQAPSLINTDINLIDRSQNILGFYPSKITKTNGVAFNYFIPIGDPNKKRPTTNGIEIDINPLTIIMAPIAGMANIIHFSSYIVMENNIDKKMFENLKKVNGIHASLIKLNPMIVNGIDLNVSGTYKSKINGISLSGLTNKQSVINGMTISVLGNDNIICNGLQIGLFNSSKTLKGIQLGVWNTNQKRSFPLINWNFK